MRLEAIPVETPYRGGRFAISGSSGDSARSVLVALHGSTGDDGPVRGLGEAVPSKRVLGVDEEEILRGLERAREELESLKIDPESPPPEVPLPSEGDGLPKGPVACALDGALLDAWAQAKGQPLWRALDLPEPGIDTTATVSLADPDEMMEETGRFLEAGFRHLKVKLGEDPESDERRIRAVREAAPDAPLRVDANEGWTRLQAVRMSGVLADVGTELLEQPLPRDASVEDHHAVNRACEEYGLPHVLDEAVHTARDVERIAQERLAHGVNLKLQKAGGLRPGLRLVETAREHGLRVMVGCFIETWAGICLALQLAGRVDWADLDGAWLLAREPVSSPDPLLEDGRLTAGHRPGLGLVTTVPGISG